MFFFFRKESNNEQKSIKCKKVQRRQSYRYHNDIPDESRP